MTKVILFPKMSEARKGKHYSVATEFKVGVSAPHKGRKCPKMAQAKIGSLNPMWGKRGKLNPLFKGGYERKLFLNRRRKASKKANGGRHTYEEWLDLCAKFDLSCAFCFRKKPEIELTADHILPLSKGGTDDIKNIQPLCQSCNSKKGDKLISLICA
jgi:hypothetical protein